LLQIVSTTDGGLNREFARNRVKSEVPAQRLVVWKPGDGWEPICEALNLPVPDEPFPHANSADDFIEKLM
jgi:hypothetical protein